MNLLVEDKTLNIRKTRRKHAPFSLYRKETNCGYFWYARFWDEHAGRYSTTRATGVGAIGKRGRRAEAEEAARRMLTSLSSATDGMNIIDYLKNFWMPNSAYFKEMLANRGAGASGNYLATAQSIIKNHIEPYEPFKSIGMLELSPAHLRAFKNWEIERGVSGNRINKTFQTMRVAMRHFLSDNDTKSDPFTKIKPAYENRAEKGVLTLEESLALLNAPSKNTTRRLAILLGALCGMRQGEVRGIQWKDIDLDTGVIHIRHNWQDLDGLKKPKWNSFRDVPIPAPLAGLLTHYRSKQNATGFLFPNKSGKAPLCIGFFRNAFIRELEAIGIPGQWHSRLPQPQNYTDHQRQRNLSFHSLRHTFVSLARESGINSFQVQTLSGHKSSAIMERYSHGRQVINLESCKTIMNNYLTAQEST